MTDEATGCAEVTAVYIRDLLAELAALRAERDALAAKVERLETPSVYWDWEDSENGSHDLTEIVDPYEPGEVVRVRCAKNLPDQWAVGFMNDTGGFEAVAFATEAEAVAFSDARAALNGAS